jgi:hypothetical protein
MHVAISGTQFGFQSAEQFMAFTSCMYELMSVSYLRGEDLHFHHGDCIGVDEQAAKFMNEMKVTREHAQMNSPVPLQKIIVEAHPGQNKRGDSPKRAFVPADVVHPTKDYLYRDREMVELAENVLIVPKGFREEQFGGTWYTFRHARKDQQRRREGGHFIHMIWRDGARWRLNYTSDWPKGGRHHEAGIAQ